MVCRVIVRVELNSCEESCVSDELQVGNSKLSKYIGFWNKIRGSIFVFIYPDILDRVRSVFRVIS